MDRSDGELRVGYMRRAWRSKGTVDFTTCSRQSCLAREERDSLASRDGYKLALRDACCAEDVDRLAVADDDSASLNGDFVGAWETVDGDQCPVVVEIENANSLIEMRVRDENVICFDDILDVKVFGQDARAFQPRVQEDGEAAGL